MNQKPRPHKSYPNWRQREARMLIWALAVGAVVAGLTGLLIYFMSRNTGAN